MKEQPKPDPREIRQLPLQLTVREKKNEDGSTVRTIAGSILYNRESAVMTDWFGDQFVEEIASGAFDESLDSRAVVALWSHRTDQVLGSTKSGTLRLTRSKESLDFELDLPNTKAGDDAYESIRRGDVDGVSFGMLPTKDKWAKIDRDSKKMYKRTILSAELYEISPVAFPAYPDNQVACRSLDSYREEVKRQDRELQKRRLVLELELS